MNLTGIELYLKQAMGLDVSSVGISSIQRAVQVRMKAVGLNDVHLYENLARTSRVEAQELIEAVIVPETWFFRDRESFASLARLATEEWSGVRPGEALRLLSLPCSTGEEPYSMAMTLLDAGLPPERFRIDGIDISRTSLEHARHGLYGKNSFRGTPLDFRDWHFEAEKNGWRLSERVKNQVQFTPGNLIDGSIPGLQLYDAIFCRNVLIYFDAEAREQAVATLDRLLQPEGVLFMGPSETGLLPSDRFAPARLTHHHPFALRKAEAIELDRDKTETSLSAYRRATATGVMANWEKLRPRPTMPQPSAAPFSFFQPATVPPAKTENSLDQVMLLANQGRLSEAAACCDACLREQGPSARAYYLMGLIRDAGRQQQEAAEFYRKALYLDPQNEEVLAHLSSLLKSQGDEHGARLLLNRARRLTQRQGT